DALIIGIGNGRQAGGGQQLCPNALINDGLLQLRIFTGDDIIPALVSTLKSDEENPNIIEGASAWFEIESPHDITFNLDGEPLNGRKFRIEMLPAALHCRLPPDCPLLR
ncbi:lipid kinase YegS, partial [Escherichia albertii]|nr:lipid kinase YegS [Escherichia albertii]